MEDAAFVSMSRMFRRTGLGLIEVVLATGILALAAVCVLSVLSPAIRASERVHAHRYALDAVAALRYQSEAPEVIYYDTRTGEFCPEARGRALRIECALDPQMDSSHHYIVAVYQGEILLYETQSFF